LWKSSYSSSFKKWIFIFMGSWSLWIARTSWHINISSRWRWLSLLAYTKISECIEQIKINSCFMWRCPYNCSFKLRRNLLFWWRILRITRIWKYFRYATRCWLLSFYASAEKNWQPIKLVYCLVSLRRFSFNGFNKRRSNICMGRSHVWLTRFRRYKRFVKKYWLKTILTISNKSSCSLK
jgi:hypothetical protein